MAYMFAYQRITEEKRQKYVCDGRVAMLLAAESQHYKVPALSPSKGASQHQTLELRMRTPKAVGLLLRSKGKSISGFVTGGVLPPTYLRRDVMLLAAESQHYSELRRSTITVSLNKACSS